jgi:hypothetical protein
VCVAVCVLCCFCQAELCNKRLGRAGKLTNLLGDELVRWVTSGDAIANRTIKFGRRSLVTAITHAWLGADFVLQVGRYSR